MPPVGECRCGCVPPVHVSSRPCRRFFWRGCRSLLCTKSRLWIVAATECIGHTKPSGDRAPRRLLRQCCGEALLEPTILPTQRESSGKPSDRLRSLEPSACRVQPVRAPGRESPPGSHYGKWRCCDTRLIRRSPGRLVRSPTNLPFEDFAFIGIEPVRHWSPTFIDVHEVVA